MDKRHLSYDLYELIQSLTKNEKIYFKRYSSFHVKGEINKYVLLFDCLNKQKEFNLQQAIEEVNLKKSQSRNIKKYLYELILKSLEQYHSSTSIDAQLGRLLCQIEILMNKNLSEHAEVLIQKGISMAEKYGKSNYKLEFLNWKKRVFEVNSFSKNSMEEIKDLVDACKNTLNTIHEEEDFWLLKVHSYWLVTKKGGFIDEEFNKVFEMHSLEKDKNLTFKESSFKTRLHYLSSIANLHSYKGEWSKVLNTRRKIVSLFEENPDLLKANIHSYIGALYNLLVAFFNLRLYENEVYETINKINLAPETFFKNKAVPESIQLQIFSYTGTIEPAILANTGQWEKAIQRIKVVQDGLLKFENKINRFLKLVILYNISYIHFAYGNLEESDRWIDIMIYDTETTTGDQYYIQARILKLIIQFEMGNYFLFDYMTKSTKRYVLKRRHQYKYEACLINFFLTFNKSHFSKHDIPVSFKKLKQELILIKNDPMEKLAMSYFDFECWCDSHIKNISYKLLFNKEK